MLKHAAEWRPIVICDSKIDNDGVRWSTKVYIVPSRLRGLWSVVSFFQ